MRHDKIKNGDELSCDLCDFATPYQNSLRGHIKSIHLDIKNTKPKGKKVKRHKCNLCDHVTHNILEAHIQAVHENVANLKCLQCDSVTAYRTAFYITRKECKPKD
jgi:uncharacterized C2H2 Zn-finger protein